MGIREIAYKGDKAGHKVDSSSDSIYRNPNKCIMCRRCETMCTEVQTVGVLSGVNRGFNTVVGTFFNADMMDTECRNSWWTKPWL